MTTDRLTFDLGGSSMRTAHASGMRGLTFWSAAGARGGCEEAKGRILPSVQPKVRRERFRSCEDHTQPLHGPPVINRQAFP